jgi:UDP-glucose 4-epimerase
MSHVVVTGGAGFIGSHLAALLVARDEEVVAVDDLSSGRRENVPDSVRLVEEDVREVGQMAEVFTGARAVLHVAGQASISRSFEAPERDLSVNVSGTLAVIEACVRAGVPRLVYASSMTVYGEPTRVPTPEDEPCVPVSYYGITKYAAERYAQIVGQRADVELSVTSLRMFNVYGERQSLTNPYQGVLAIFLGNVLREEPITIHSDGRQTRDFVYVGDVADAWLRVLDEPAAVGRTFNVGSGRETSIVELSDSLLRALGESRETWDVRFEKAQRGDISRSAADIAAISAATGWSPSVSLEAGLAHTLAWARETEAEQPRV